MGHIHDALKEAAAHDKYQEESPEYRERLMKEEREQRRIKAQHEMKHEQIMMEEEEEDAVNSAALPLELRPFHEKTNAKGYREHEKENIQLQPIHLLNMKQLKSFPA